MLGEKLNNLVNDKLQQEENERKRLEDEKNNKILTKIGYVTKIIDSIKFSTEDIVNGIQKVKTDNKGNVFTTDMEKAVGQNLYCDFQAQYRESGIEFNEFFGRLKLPITEYLQDFKQWQIDNGIEKVIIKFDHDGVGQESWNTYWVKPKN